MTNADMFSYSGLINGVFGTINSSISSYYNAETEKYQLKSQAISQEFSKTIGDLNATIEEMNGEWSALQGDDSISIAAMRHGQELERARASMAASGIELGSGSALEVQLTSEYLKKHDMLTIKASSMREMTAARMRAANYRAQGALAGVSASNLNASADTISSGSRAFNTALSGMSTVAENWYKKR